MTWKLFGAGVTLQNFSHCSNKFCVYQLVSEIAWTVVHYLNIGVSQYTSYTYAEQGSKHLGMFSELFVAVLNIYILFLQIC